MIKDRPHIWKQHMGVHVLASPCAHPIYPVDLPWNVASITSVGLARTPEIPADVSHSRSSLTMGADTSMIELSPLDERSHRFVLAGM